MLSPEGIFLEEEVEELLFPGEHGPTAILPNHTVYIGAVKGSGVAKVISFGKTRYFSVLGGAVWVEPTKRVVLLSDEIEGPFEENNAKEYAKARKTLFENKENLSQEELKKALSDLKLTYGKGK